MKSIKNIFNTLSTVNEAGPNGDVSWMGKDANGKRWEDYDTIVCPDGQVIDMVKLLEDQQRAQAALLHLFPFFSSFVGKLRRVYTFKVKTQATDGYNLFINPQFTYNLDMTGKAFVLAHEIMHCVLNHLRRAQSKNHDMNKSNIAADYEVNCWLVDMDMVRPSDIAKLNALYDAKYSGWGYEKIYDSNPSGSGNTMDNSSESGKAQQNQKGQQGQQQQQQSGGGSGSGNQTYSDQYKAGWNQAMEDYKNGKLKL